MQRRQDVDLLLHPSSGVTHPLQTDTFDPETVSDMCLSCERLRRCKTAADNRKAIDRYVCGYYHRETFPRTVANMAVIGMLGEYGKTVVVRRDFA